MKIAAIDEVNKDRNGRHNQAKRFLGILNWIKIWNPQDYDAINYATVIHELAHATHWNRDNSAYNDSETIVQESWANGVEWYLTKMIYPGKTGGYRHGDYTGIVEDMVDWDGSENDYVGGYTMTELESSILYQTTWDGWKNNIINNYDNGTEWTLPALFTFWAIVPAK